MARIKLAQGGGGFISEAGERVLLQVQSADYKEDFGKINIVLVNKKGERLQNNFVISKNGKVNEGALKAFSFFVRQVMGEYVDDIEVEQLVGKYVEADIVMNPGSRPNEDGETVYFANIDKVYDTTKTFNSTQVPTQEVNDDEEDGWD